jgi:hypothetical protein
MEHIFHNENTPNQSPLLTPAEIEIAEKASSQEREDIVDFDLTTTVEGDYYYHVVYSDGTHGPELNSGVSGSVSTQEARNTIARSLGLPGEQ